MKIIPNVTRWLSVAGVLVLTAVACQKQDSSLDSPQQKEEFAMAASQSETESDVVFDDVFNNVMGVNDEVALGGTGIFGSANTSGSQPDDEILSGTNGTDTTHCFTVSITQLDSTQRFPLQVVIDFGTGCTDPNGRTRQGKIIIVYTGRLIMPGASASVTFDGYYLDSIHVEGTYKVTNESTQTKRALHIQVIDAKLSKPNGNYAGWNCDRTITQVAGVNTPLIALDDVFELSGQANGAVKLGDKYYQWATVITDPLVKRFTCRWIVQGSVTIRKSNRPVAVLDYGTGDCDRKATLTVDGVVHEITLH